MYDTDALQELHACHNLRSLPGLLSDEASVARFGELVRDRKLSVSTITQPGQLSAVLKALDTDSPRSTPCEKAAAEDSVPGTDCGCDVADRAARIEQDVSLWPPVISCLMLLIFSLLTHHRCSS
jgi:hypothetical protein